MQNCIADKLQPGLTIADKMEENKLDLQKPRLVSQLFMGDEARLAILKKHLGSIGWPAVADGADRLLASATTTTNRQWIEDNTRAMCRMAAEAGVEWDGWDVDVAADNIISKPQRAVSW